MIRYIAAAAILAASPGFAETIESAGKAMGTSTTEAIPIAEGHVVLKTAGVYESFDVPDNHPLKGATGECYGTAEVKGTSVSGGGVCVFTAADGETMVNTWHAKGFGEGGALEGDWAVSGGTGKWATASGGGTFSSLTDPDTAKFVNTVTGTYVFE